MNISQFLDQVDKQCEKMDKNELSVVIHELARILEASEREHFMSQLLNAGEDSKIYQKGEIQNLSQKVDEIFRELEKIENGEIAIEAELNEEYDDWYSSDEDEFLYSDPEKIGSVLERAACILKECVRNGAYDQGCRIGELLLSIQVYVESEYDCEELSLVELERYNLANVHCREILLDTLYAEYHFSDAEKRAEILYYMITTCKDVKITLEMLMQHEDELPNFADFLEKWIHFLCNMSGSTAQRLLEEALELKNDPEEFLNTARKNARNHPGIFERYIIDRTNKDNKRDVIELCAEAVHLIPEKYIVRGRIASIAAQISHELNMDEQEKYYKMEAFRSYSTIPNYMSVKLTTINDDDYKEKLKMICKDYYSKKDQEQHVYLSKSNELCENRIDKNISYMLAFLEGEFDYVIKSGLNKKEALGWSFTFMKPGIAAFLLLLQGKQQAAGSKSMSSILANECGYTSITEFDSDFDRWKKYIPLSMKEKERYLKK